MNMQVHRPVNEVDITQTVLLAACLIRLGGQVTFTEEEMRNAAADGHGVSVVADATSITVIRESHVNACARHAAMHGGSH